MCAESVGWSPINNEVNSLNNNSSVVYNIINHENNLYTGFKNQKIFDKKITNKKKAITEFSDLNKLQNTNFNNDYPQFMKDKVFHRYNGVFSQMYNVALRNGNLVMPFKNKETELEKEQDYYEQRFESPTHQKLSRRLAANSSINQNSLSLYKNTQGSMSRNKDILTNASSILNTSIGSPRNHNQSLRSKK